MERQEREAYIQPKGEVAIIKGSENIFRDLGHPDAETLQLKAQLASQMIAVLNKRTLKGKKAAESLGMTEADISRIRNADLSRFTLDRLVEALNRLSMHVEIKVTQSRSPRMKHPERSVS